MSTTILGLLILGLAFEGIICLALAAPIGYILAGLGGFLGYVIQDSSGKSLNTIICSPIALLGLMLTESKFSFEPPTNTVVSTIVISATPDKVWKNVVGFPEIPEPTEWIFNTGIAYPIRATINGNGVGAIRRCEFSTGAFIEPIEVWEENTILRFGVTSSPPPMQEWSLFRTVSPPHLQGYFEATLGEFKLERLDDKTTKLTGTTEYKHNIWPIWYWRPLTNYIIHSIHDRVLQHIKNVCEK